VLERHWPGVERFEDVTILRDPPPVDLLCGGPPCQPFSTASRGRRVADDLWPEMLVVVLAVQPLWVVVENVSKQAIRGFEGDLQEAGYQTIPFELAASMVGAPHDRPRWFLVAHANRDGEPRLALNGKVASLPYLSSVAGWANEPGCLGVDDGVPRRVDRSRRLKALGNAVVPAVGEAVGRVIRELEQRP